MNFKNICTSHATKLLGERSVPIPFSEQLGANLILCLFLKDFEVITVETTSKELFESKLNP